MRSSVERMTRDTSEVTMIVDDEPRGDLDAVRPLDDVGDRGVDEHQRDQHERDAAAAAWLAQSSSVTATAAGRHQHQHAGRVRAALGVDVGLEEHGDEERDRGEEQHQRPRRPGPFRRHAVARQVARHQVQQPGHRRRAGEPQDGDGAQVVDGAEDLAEMLVREVRERAARRRAALLRTPRAESAAS